MKNGTPSLNDCIQLACLMEVTARKPGNVHRFQDFDDLTYMDFVLSAMACAPFLTETEQMGVGKAVLAAIQATRRVVRTNSNLGMVLLLAPLAAVPRVRLLVPAIAEVLNGLDIADSQFVFEAIRLAKPAGLGEAAEQDVRSEPTLPLKAIMALAQDRDLIAKQYACDYRDVFEIGVPALKRGMNDLGSLESAIIFCHLHLLAALPDTLIQRKRGLAVAQQASRMARQILAQGWPRSLKAQQAFADFDTWLRADGHARNPGSTADLVAACLFVALRDGIIQMPAVF